MIRPLLWLPVVALSVSAVAANEANLEKQARKLHALAGSEQCHEPDDYMNSEDYRAWTIEYRPSWADDSYGTETITLIRMFCSAGAYNISYVYYLHDQYDNLRPVAFASPDIDVKYVDDDYEGEVERIDVVGMHAGLNLENSEYDADEQLIYSSSKWRGLGDASSSGTWKLKDGEFVLAKYEVDASYDGEFNAEAVVDYLSASAE